MKSTEDAPKGAVRGDGDGAQQLSDSAGMADEPDLVAADARLRLKSVARRPIKRVIPSLPPNQEPSLATYAGNQTAAYKQQSILTAPPGRLVVMLYDGCLRFLFQSAYAMREGDRVQSQDRMRRAEAIIDELTVTLDHERGGEVASRLQGIYAFCRRHLIEASMEQDPHKIEEVSELLDRAARGLGRDRRRGRPAHDARGPLGRSGRARRARARPGARRTLGGGPRRRPPTGSRPRSPSAHRRPRPGPISSACSSFSTRSPPGSPSRAPPPRASSASMNRGRTAMRGYGSALGTASARRFRPR